MKKILILMAFIACLPTVVQAKVYRAPLHNFATSSSFNLRCIMGQNDISIPVPERWNVTDAVLTLDYINSASLLGERSHLIVTMNGASLGQITLNKVPSSGRVQLRIPPALLRPGYNTLNLKAIQHYAAQCEQVCSPSLWTTVNLNESALEITYELKPVPLRMSAVSDFLFDQKIQPEGNVHLITAGLESGSATMAGIIASGVARKFDYRKVFFSISQDIVPEMDNILIGDRKFIELFLQQRGIAISIPGSYLKILHLPLGNGIVDTRHALMVVSGNTSEEIKIAAETLAHLSLPYPGGDDMVVKEFKLPDISLYGGRQVLTVDKAYTLKTLNLETHTFVGFNPNPRSISFRLPADFLVKPNQYSKLNLNFAYGAGMRSDSVLNLVVNGQSVRVIHLKNQDGESIEGYRVDLPTYIFKPGNNTISFEATLNTTAQECDIMRPEGFFLTIFENSTFFFPAMPHFVEMPKLELFMMDGFPITRWPDGFESMIYVTRKDLDTTAAALNLVGLISQKNGYPLFGSTISYERPVNWTGEMVVIGDVASLPEDLTSLAPLKLAKTNVVPYPVIRDWEQDLSFAFSGQVSSLGPDRGVIMQFQSSSEMGRSVIVLTGAGPAQVSALGKALLESGVQNGIKGDLTLIDLKDPAAGISSVNTGRTYYTGTSGFLFKLEYLFYKYSFLLYVLLALGLLAGGGLLYYLLRILRRKRTRSDDGSPKP